jgi:hypothetical protein
LLQNRWSFPEIINGQAVPVAGPATLARRAALISAGDLPGLNGVIERDDFPLCFRRQP